MRIPAVADISFGAFGKLCIQPSDLFNVQKSVAFARYIKYPFVIYACDKGIARWIEAIYLTETIS